MHYRVYSLESAYLFVLCRYLGDEDDGVSEAIIPFAVQYVGILKVISLAHAQETYDSRFVDRSEEDGNLLSYGTRPFGYS